jgi:hypothetical protein
MYTDLRAELDDVSGAFCPGLEAPFGQLNLAFKRLVVPNHLNPDGTVPPSVHPGLPWWDMMRYMWRGVASVKIRRLTAVLANTHNPHVAPRHDRIALTAATFSLGVSAGRIDVTTTNMSAHAHTAPPDASLSECALTWCVCVLGGTGNSIGNVVVCWVCVAAWSTLSSTHWCRHRAPPPPPPHHTQHHAGDSSLLLPAFHLPLANVAFNITTKLPGGRSALFHHVFPILAAPPPGPDAPPQEVVDVFGLMKCEGWALGIDIAVSSDKTGTASGHARSGGVSGAAAGVTGGLGTPAAAAGGVSLGGPAGAAGSAWHYFQPYSLPHAFIGEFQLQYIINMVDCLVNPSPVVRLCRKLKPHYARDRRPEAAVAARAVAAVRAGIVAMPLLKQRVEISLTADAFRVHHDAQDADDPSDMVFIALSR